MKRSLLLQWQLLTALSDTATGLLLIAAPQLTLRLMKLHTPVCALPFLSWIGVFVLSVGAACLYGALLALRNTSPDKLEVVWLLTAITRGLVAFFVLAKVAAGALEPAWSTVAVIDGAFALLQGAGLAGGWLRHVHD